MRKIKDILITIYQASFVIGFFLVFILSIVLFFYLGILLFIKIITYQPDTIKKYEYVDLNDNKGIAISCSNLATYPSCYLEDKTTIAVKQYKEIWIPNPNKVK